MKAISHMSLLKVKLIKIKNFFFFAITTSIGDSHMWLEAAILDRPDFFLFICFLLQEVLLTILLYKV